ncbi:flagellar biosynthesis repressor FlbT [Roseobacter sp. HKCCA0434]|uniref:flagellar biosynthesis repressor FlbT n=1 Tax=Roseobacter sp. HKCCA0434 TaxID=3079297 RepID=UPI002905F379|nr:flagellar biosynthesis repressor FlbT [Roseobacter sp. HKCCA0434]
MSGLILKLRPGERVLINGAVIENGDRRARLGILTPGAHILRLRDAIHPDDATTPTGRLCYLAQLIIAGEAEPEEGLARLSQGVEQLGQVFTSGDGHVLLTEAKWHLDCGQTYKALRKLKSLMPIEAALFELSAMRA